MQQILSHWVQNISSYVTSAVSTVIRYAQIVPNTFEIDTATVHDLFSQDRPLPYFRLIQLLQEDPSLSSALNNHACTVDGLPVVEHLKLQLKEFYKIISPTETREENFWKKINDFALYLVAVTVDWALQHTNQINMFEEKNIFENVQIIFYSIKNEQSMLLKTGNAIVSEFVSILYQNEGLPTSAAVCKSAAYAQQQVQKQIRLEKTFANVKNIAKAQYADAKDLIVHYASLKEKVRRGEELDPYIKEAFDTERGTERFKNWLQDELQSLTEILDLRATILRSLDNVSTEEKLEEYLENGLKDRLRYLYSHLETIRLFARKDNKPKDVIPFLYSCDALAKYNKFDQASIQINLKIFQSNQLIIKEIYQHFPDRFAFSSQVQCYLKASPSFFTYLSSQGKECNNQDACLKDAQMYESYFFRRLHVYNGAERITKMIHVDEYDEYVAQELAKKTDRNKVSKHIQWERYLNRRELRQMDQASAATLHKREKKQKSAQRKSENSTKMTKKQLLAFSIASKKEQDNRTNDSFLSCKGGFSLDVRKKDQLIKKEWAEHFIPKAESGKAYATKEKTKTRGLSSLQYLQELPFFELHVQEETSNFVTIENGKILVTGRIWKNFQNFWDKKTQALPYRKFKSLFTGLGGSIVKPEGNGTSHRTLEYVDLQQKFHQGHTFRPHGFMKDYGKHSLAFLRTYFEECYLTPDHVCYRNE